MSWVSCPVVRKKQVQKMSPEPPSLPGPILPTPSHQTSSCSQPCACNTAVLTLRPRVGVLSDGQHQDGVWPLTRSLPVDAAEATRALDGECGCFTVKPTSLWGDSRVSLNRGQS